MAKKDVEKRLVRLVCYVEPDVAEWLEADRRRSGIPAASAHLASVLAQIARAAQAPPTRKGRRMMDDGAPASAPAPPVQEAPAPAQPQGA